MELIVSPLNNQVKTLKHTTVKIMGYHKSWIQKVRT